MIDIYDFIDSVALREHLKKEGCDLSPLDRAGIAWRSQKRSLQEKLAVMRELLSNSENFPLPFSEYTDENNNFHFLLREWIETKQKYLDEFLRKDPAQVYAYHISMYSIRDRDFYDLEHFETLFADYETCRSRCMKDLEYCDKEDTLAPERLAQARMIRMMTDPEHEENALNAQLNEVGEPTDITALPDWSDGAFWQFCPSVPSPFRPGDFVYSIAGRTTDLPAVYLGKGSEISAADRFLPPNANPDRLYALTYDPEDGVSLFDERGCSPFELDLAPEPLKGADRMLYAIRAYVLGEIHLGDLFAFDRIARADARAEQARDRMRTVDLFALRDLVSPKKDDNP